MNIPGEYSHGIVRYYSRKAGVNFHEKIRNKFRGNPVLCTYALPKFATKKISTMKMLRPIAMLLALASLTSCFNITEEFWFNKDRSGRYQMTFDVPAAESFMGMFQAMQQASDSTGKNELRDTVLNMASLPDSIKRRLPYPALADRTKIAVSMKQKMQFSFMLDFKDVEEVNRFWDNFSRLDSVSGPGNSGELGGIAAMHNTLNSMKNSVHWEGKQLVVNYESADKPTPGMDNPMLEMKNNPMLKLMFANNTYSQIFHFEGKVKKVSGKNIKKDGRTVTATYPLSDVITHPETLTCSIKMRK